MKINQKVILQMKIIMKIKILKKLKLKVMKEKVRLAKIQKIQNLMKKNF